MGIPSLQPLLPSLVGSLTTQTWTWTCCTHGAMANSKEAALEKPLAISKTHPDISSPVFETIPSILGRDFVTQSRF